MTALALKWVVSNYGSADLYWLIGDENIRIHSTYVGDGLTSIMQAAIDLRLGSSATIATFLAEPGGCRIFFSGADNEVYIQIVLFDDLQSDENLWAGGALRWHGRVNVIMFVEAVRDMAEEVLARFETVDAYARAWGGGEFPMDMLVALRQPRG